MARLQRKKTSGGKKKKKQRGSIAASPGTKNYADPRKMELFADSGKDPRKRPPSSPKKLSAGIGSTGQGKLGNYLNKGIDFLREVKVELKKVTWPTRKQTVGSTVVMIILVIIISFFLGAVDIALSSIINVVLKMR